MTAAQHTTPARTPVPQADEDPASERRAARFAGAMFLVVMIASIGGGSLIAAAQDPATVTIGALLEIVNALAVIGIVAGLWRSLRRRFPSAAVGYLGVRVLEAGVCAAAALLPLVSVALTETGSIGADTRALLAVARSTLVNDAVPVVFGIGALILYAMLDHARLVPRVLALWGGIGAVLIIANVPLDQPVLALPIITNELVLGGYLIVRGLPVEP